MGESLFKCLGKPCWLSLFLNNLFLQPVPQFSTSFIIIGINKVFNGLCLISLEFLGNLILGDKVKMHRGPKMVARWLNSSQNYWIKKIVPQGGWSLILKICPRSICNYIFIITHKRPRNTMHSLFRVIWNRFLL